MLGDYLDFIFYGVELNPALEISDQSSKVKVSHTEISYTFCEHFKELLLTTKSLFLFYFNIKLFLLAEKFPHFYE